MRLSRAACGLILLLAVLSPCLAQAQLSLFDAHLHYNPSDARQYSPQQIIQILRDSQIHSAVITSRPPSQALLLHRLAPQRIVPILGVYRDSEDKRLWMYDKGLPQRLQQQLATGPWRGVGELHIFALQRHSPVFLRIVELATEHKLPLLMHCDPATIDTLFAHAPQAKVIWAHAGAYPYPPLLRDYLQRYPNLYVDLSVRDERIAPDGEIDAAWEWLLTEYSDRFLIGVDTYRTQRWQQYPELAERIRHWLGQLPAEVATAIGSENGKRLFATQ